MLVEMILWSVLFMVLLWLLHHFFPRLGRVLFWLSTLLFIITLAGGVFLFLDAREFREQMAVGKNTFLLEKDGRLLAGMELASPDLDRVTFFTGPDLIPMQQDLDDRDLASLKGDSYKLFLFSTDAFSTIGDVQIDRKSYPVSSLLGLLSSDHPLDDFVQEQMGNTTIPPAQMNLTVQAIQRRLGIADPAGFKGYLFATLMGAAIQQDGPLFILDQFRRHHLTIHEETVMFRFLRVIPEGLFIDVVEKANLYKDSNP
ncbi:MAG: hypothetical protein GXP63_05455 [DPANN group archaeon]|nr:hypothetical protein [DPANN group archaeon]